MPSQILFRTELNSKEKNHHFGTESNCNKNRVKSQLPFGNRFVQFSVPYVAAFKMYEFGYQ